MKSFFYFLGTLFFIASCVSNEQAKKLNIINNTDSEEITFILELKIISESKAEVEKFTQYLADFIVKREPSTVYGYFISEDGKKVTLIERYNNSEDGIQHGKDFVNGPNFKKFFELFTIESFITIGNASHDFKQFASDNGFQIEYRSSIGGYVRR
tara:strand:- start:1902 stop:2366 length:465 start_codon:yes stop_codon:yes gene_type:complete